MTIRWEPVTVGEFTVRELAATEIWSQTPGDATAETILEETAWEGAGAPPGLARAKIERWQELGTWFLGLYRDGLLIGLYDVGYLTTWSQATGEVADGGADVMAESVDLSRRVQVTVWMATRPTVRDQVPGDAFRVFSEWFLRGLWDVGIRQMVMNRSLTVHEGRAYAQQVEQYGWRPIARHGLTETKVKRLERRP